MKIRIDVRELKESTAQAIEAGKKEAAELAAKKLAEQEMKEKERKLKAELIIGQIPERAATEAKNGRSHGIVMNVDSEERELGVFCDGKWKCNPSSLTGSAAIVWEACVEAELAPTLEFWHDGVGNNSGYNIVVHW